MVSIAAVAIGGDNRRLFALEGLLQNAPDAGIICKDVRWYFPHDRDKGGKGKDGRGKGKGKARDGSSLEFRDSGL